jgi:hypothetical protein
MADTKISALTAATTPLAGTEVLPIVQSGATVKVSVANLTAGRTFDALGMTLTSTDAGATAAPLLDLYRDSASPAASDTLGEIEFNGEDSAGNKQAYGLIHASILSPTSTAEQGQIHFETATAGALTEKMIIGTTNLVINEIGAVFNVRIEGDTDANLFYTDATNSRVGIGTASPSSKLQVSGEITTTTLQTSGKLSIGTAATAGVFNYIVGSNSADIVSYWANVLSVLMYTGAGNVAYASGENGADAAFYARKGPATSRSINAAGTVNAAGLDYAEYMEKSGNFTIAKGDICGVDVNGKLTNVFADALSFVVKSTNPSYVGGDVWGSEESIGLIKPMQPADDATDEEKAQYAANKTAFDAALEAARQNVDRIAFCGQVPVNVTGASAGQYIIPVNNNGAIKGEAVSNPTFEQYQKSVGKVISVTNDAPMIIVKIA